MSLIILSEDDKSSLDAIEEGDLDRIIEDAVWSGRSDELRRLPLSWCGPFVSGRLRKFEAALSRFAEARSAAKRATTQEDARRAGNDLSHAVSQMKYRRDREEKEGKLFHIEDRFIHDPYTRASG